MKYLACFSLLCSSMASAIERPNIIYIFTDQQTASAMSCAEIRICTLPTLTVWQRPVYYLITLIVQLHSVPPHVELCLQGTIRMQ